MTLRGTVITRCSSAQLAGRSAVLSATKRMPAMRVTPKKCDGSRSCAGLRRRVGGAGEALPAGGGGARQAALEGAQLGGQGVGDLGALGADRPVDAGDEHAQRR